MRRLSHAGMLALIMTLALAGCGSVVTGQTSAKATTTPTTPTTTPTTTPSPTSQANPYSKCAQPPISFSPADVPATTLDGMTVTAYTQMGNLAYPQTRIPDGAPLAPYNLLSGAQAGFYPSTVQVNPGMSSPGGGYVLLICNTSGQTRRINGVTVTIASVTAFTGALATWKACSSQYIAEQHKVISGECGGSDIEHDYMRATFAPHAGAGATATATMISVSPIITPALGPLPVSLPPNQMMSIEIGLIAPTAPATYVFSFALAVDGAAPRTVATSQPTLLAPVTQTWSGDACQTPAMLAKMPASGQYACQPAS